MSATYGPDIVHGCVEMVRRGDFFRVTLARSNRIREATRRPRVQEPVGFDELSVGNR
jgi:hypothetical protein